MTLSCGSYRFVAAPSLISLLLAGCAGAPSIPATSPSPAPAPSSISPEALVGRWGLASYHRDSDRARTEAEAKRQCSIPYVIKRGPNGGLMMHLADNSQPQELVLKGTANGSTFLGPTGAPGGPEDREIVSVSHNLFTVAWVNPDNAGRFGTMIYVRCA